MSKRGYSGSIDTKAPKASRKSNESPPQTSKKDSLLDNASNAIERNTAVEKNEKCTDKNQMTKMVLSTIETSSSQSTIDGELFNTLLAVSIILQQFRKKNQFIVATEMAKAGKFGDILYHNQSPEGTITTCIQAKHKKNAGRSITKNDLLITDGEYSIPMYFSSFLKVDPELTNCKTETDEMLYAICTNIDLHTNAKPYFMEIDPQEDDSLQFCEAIGATCYQLYGHIPGLMDQLKKSCKGKFKTDSELHKQNEDFFGKFRLICNSSNKDELRVKAKDLLPKWCDKDKLETVIDRLQALLNNTIGSKKRFYLNLERMQNWFLKMDLNQNISELKRYSKEYLESVHEIHAHIEVNLKGLEGFKLYAFLKDESGCKTFEFKNALDMTVSSRILSQALSLLKYETIFVDSTKYATHQEMNDILDDLLSYLRDVNHPTIKVVTILGKHDTVSIDKIKEISKNYHQKIVVVEKMSESSQNDKTFERILVKDLSEEASRKLYKQTERMMFGTNTPLSSIVEETDDLTFLIDVLKVCESREVEDRNLNKRNYELIRDWYVRRCFVPYKQKRTEKYDYHLYRLSDDDVQNALASNDEEPDPPGLQNGDGGKVCIFLNDAGLGKSSYFTWLAWRISTSDPTLFVIKFIAMEYSTDFDQLKRSTVDFSDINIPMIFYRFIHLALFVPNINSCTIEDTNKHRDKADLCAKLLTFSNGRIILDETKNNDLLIEELIELRLFREKFNEQKIVLILDGFDEIAPHYKDVAMKLFARFARLDGVRSLFLSSRPYGFEEDLKKAFDPCRMYRLIPFSKVDIIISFNKFLLINLEGYEHYEEKHQNNILRTLYDIIVNVLKGIIIVPLLLYMVQIILLPVIRQHVNEKECTISKHILNDIKIDKLYLVEHFIDKKIQILNTNKKGLTDSAGMSAAAQQDKDQSKKKSKKQHILLAMYVIFDKTDREKLLSTKEQKRADEIMEEIKQGVEKTGIVLGVQNGVPQFLHRTFAEYFTACWLFKNWERFKSESIFQSQTIWSSSMKQTREFFDRLILKESKGCDLHLAVVNRSQEQIEEILRSNPFAVTVKDKVGRLPLHLADYSGIFHSNYPKLLEKIPPEHVNEKDNLYGWNALDYAFFFYKHDLIKLLDAKGVEPNMDTLFQQVCSHQINVLLEKGSKYEHIFDHILNQKDLAEELSERVTKYLIENKQIKIDSPLAELNYLSVLEKVVTLDNLRLFRQLISKSDRQVQVLDDRTNQFFQLSLENKSYNIISFLVEQHPILLVIINDNEDLYYCAESAIKNNQMELFKTIFGKFCIEQKIECVAEDKIIDDCDDQGEDGTFEIEIPFKANCCEVFDWSGPLKTSIEALLSAAIHYGNKQMVSYILQKTNTAVTLELIKKNMKPLRIRRSEYKYKCHKNCIPVYKYLFKKFFDPHAVDEEGLNLFIQSFIEDGCVYMLASLIAIGFKPRKINWIQHWDVLQFRLLASHETVSSNIFVYLQQRTYVDFFDTLGPIGESIFEIAITNERFIVAQTLIEDKFRDLSDSKQETAVVDVLQKLIMKYEELICDFMKSLHTRSSFYRGTEYKKWHSVYSSIFNRTPIV